VDAELVGEVGDAGDQVEGEHADEVVFALEEIADGFAVGGVDLGCRELDPPGVGEESLEAGEVLVGFLEAGVIAVGEGDFVGTGAEGEEEFCYGLADFSAAEDEDVFHGGLRVGSGW